MSGDLNVFALILGASLFVKIVMGVLLLFSFLSWVIIFRKKAMLDRAMSGANEFEERFWSGADLAGLFREVSGRTELVGDVHEVTLASPRWTTATTRPC